MKNIFMYLLIFSLLFNIFQYVNSNKILDGKKRENESKINSLTNQLKSSRDSISELAYNDYFDIQKDEDAQEYFYKRNLDFQNVLSKVNEDLENMNANKKGNPLVPYEGIEGKIFLINKAKILNHRWIIAEFSNGDLWGQILVKYFYNEDKPTDFETVETVLYEKHRVE